ncbi:DUF4238 domain-containing protein [Pararhizobium sp. A13]|uniref:DUF4238 domain-containing protein n=1 Tax=Pararhizobium sp. A13 TaxID=3133975 RepID=UPI0032464EA6
MNVPKRHHFVPEMLQKNFTNDEDGLWTFDSRNAAKGVWSSTYGNLFLEGHLYSLVQPDGTKDVSLESWFSELEGQVAPIVQKIMSTARRGKLPCLSGQERQIWDFFFYQQWRRVPDLFASLLTPEQHRIEVENLLDVLVRSGRPVSNQERSDLLEPASLKRMHKNLRVATLKTGSRTVLDVIAGRGIAIGRLLHPRKSFVLGSRPVVKLTLPGITHLSDPRVEMWLPIASDVIVGMGSIDSPELLVPVSAAQARNQNEASAMQSSQIVGRSKPLIQSLSPLVGRKVQFTPVAEFPQVPSCG